MRTIYYGTILTMDDTYPQAEAVCIEEDRIIGVGSLSSLERLKEQDTQLIDLKDHVLMPSFIDAHSHFIGFANSLAQCNLVSAESFDDVEALLKKFIEENAIKKGEWVIANGYDHNFLAEKKHPTKHLLNKVSQECPILITHASNHMAVVNDIALTMNSLTYDTPDPQGGKYGRDESHKELDGYLEETAAIKFLDNIPMLDMKTLMNCIDKAQQIYASYGITTVQDGFMTKALFDILQFASQQQHLKLDVIGYADMKEAHEIVDKHPEYIKTYQNHFKIGGYKIILDGSPQGRTAWMQTPYQNDDKYYGYPVLKDEALYDMINKALHEQLQLLTHCNGDAAAQQLITQFQKVHKANPTLSTCRPVMIHAQLLRKEQMKAMYPLNMIPSFFIAHTYYWGDVHIENFGKQRADKISSVRDAIDMGLIYTFHQDSPVILPNMMETVWCAVNRITRNGIVLGKEECISTYEALKAVTLNVAYQYFEETEKGSIAVGKLADIIILDQNPLTTPHQQLKDIHVLQTIKEGIVIYKEK